MWWSGKFSRLFHMDWIITDFLGSIFVSVSLYCYYYYIYLFYAVAGAFVAVVSDFLEQQSDFMVYSTYCNSYPRALMELETYTGNSNAMALLEKYVLSSHSHSHSHFALGINIAAMPI